ncbi:MAG: hypothetical protein HZT39_04440 [Pseudoxanthomonas sp.]|nr:MAG: hypothetical protein HZT39_04440 [Pseudoxanthomonas sp.]
MSKTPLLIATAFALCATTLIADQAEARERSRAVQRTAQGGSVAVERSNARFDSQRQRTWQADGQAMRAPRAAAASAVPMAAAPVTTAAPTATPTAAPAARAARTPTDRMAGLPAPAAASAATRTAT